MTCRSRDFEHELRNAQHRVNQYAEAEKARALAGNTVDFDTLASAIRESGQGLAKAVSKMDSRHQETAARSRWNDHRRAWNSARVVVCGSHSATTSKMKLSA